MGDFKKMKFAYGQKHASNFIIFLKVEALRRDLPSPIDKPSTGCLCGLKNIHFEKINTTFDSIDVSIHSNDTYLLNGA